MTRHRPTLIGDIMRQMGLIRSDNTVDKDLVCALLGDAINQHVK